MKERLVHYFRDNEELYKKVLRYQVIFHQKKRFSYIFNLIFEVLVLDVNAEFLFISFAAVRVGVLTAANQI